MARQCDVVGGVAVTEEGRGIFGGAADPEGSALAEFGTRFGDELDLGHERTPRTLRCLLHGAPREEVVALLRRSRSCDPRRGNRTTLADGRECPQPSQASSARPPCW